MLNKKDRVIMSCLRNNARETLTRMSKLTHIPVSTIYDRLRAHEESIIQKHTTLIDFSKLGYNARANVFLKVERSNRDNLVSHLKASEHTNSLFKINNGYDLLVEFIFPDIKELEDYLDELDGQFNIKDRQMFFVIEDIKREGFLADLQLALL